MMTSFLIALQFLTRIPLTLNIKCKDEEVAASLLWYPLVGLLIGSLLVLFINLMPNVDGIVMSALLLCMWVLITGGLHLDGLADSSDAWLGSHGDKKRALEIMKDPQAGPIAVIVLILILLVKFTAITSLISYEESYLLIAAPVIARCMPLLLFLTTPYVREHGLGSAMANYLPRKLAWIVLGLVLITSILFLGFMTAILLAFIVTAVFSWLRHLMIKIIGGMTGDTIGAMIEIIEAVVLVVLVILLESL